MANLDVWNALKQPPPHALRQIQGGRLKGKSDINPQWRYHAMTEQFGTVGIGWKFEIVRVWNEAVNDGQVFAFAEVRVYINNGEWSQPIPGIGGSMLVEKEQSGLHANDEGYKMAITDALSTALKMLGVAADVYSGAWDGAKYRDDVKPPEKPATEKQEQPKEHFCKAHNTEYFKRGKMKSYAHPILDATGNKTGEWCNEEEPVTPEQLTKIFAAAGEQQIPNDYMKEYIHKTYQVTSTTHLSKEQASELIQNIETGNLA